MTDAQQTPLVSPNELSAALAALGTYSRPPTDAQLAAAEVTEGRAALVDRLSNALYGAALARVMTAEVAARKTGDGGTGFRHEAWRAAGVTGDGVAVLLHYMAIRLLDDLRAAGARVPVDLGVLAAATGAAEALVLLLQVMTVRSDDDPRAEAVTTNLARASDQLGVSAERIDGLFASMRDGAGPLADGQV